MFHAGSPQKKGLMDEGEISKGERRRRAARL
jgi:hypothetical protein